MHPVAQSCIHPASACLNSPAHRIPLSFSLLLFLIFLCCRIVGVSVFQSPLLIRLSWRRGCARPRRRPGSPLCWWPLGVATSGKTSMTSSQLLWRDAWSQAKKKRKKKKNLPYRAAALHRSSGGGGGGGGRGVTATSNNSHTNLGIVESE